MLYINYDRICIKYQNVIIVRERHFILVLSMLYYFILRERHTQENAKINDYKR